MKKTLLAGLVLALAACGGSQTTAPTGNTAEPLAVSGSNTVGAPQTIAPPPAGSTYDIAFGDNASFVVTNLSGITQAYRAYITSFDNQSVELDYRVGTVKTGDKFAGSFARTCVQLDITQNGVAGLPLAGGFAFYNSSGKAVAHPTQIDFDACRPRPTPTPSPTPSPSPSPTPLPGVCYYEVDCSSHHSFDARIATACPSSTKKSLCEAKGGSWAKWISQSKEHCRIALPGIAASNFQLTPGQSAPGCLSKHDD